MAEEYRRYPGFQQREVKSDVDAHGENLDILGYSIMESVIDRNEAARISSLLDEAYVKQEREFGADRLKKLNEHPTHRGLLAEDAVFRDMVINPKVWPVIGAILGETAILNLQNASAAFPHTKHFQSAYHKDFAKDFVVDKPISINAFWCITDFFPENGATWVVPGSHKLSYFPTAGFIERNGVQMQAPAGSVIFWDSLLLHKAGYNRTDTTRYGINHMYTRPFIKQQIDFPQYLKGKIDAESKLGQVLGFWTIPPKSVQEFRVDPDKRTYRAYQG
jgi:ectoine hydroxylase-related dioxygenase (phytanoyl-CoA dioxygenase family)